MADKTPAFQFYPADWLKDPALRSVSLEAKGAWIDLLCFMFNSEKRGFLVNASGPLTVNQIARYLGEPVRRTKRILSELDNAGVSATDETGAIYSKRMVRDEQIRQVRREAGAQGGNPDLVKQNPSKPEAKGEQTPKQILTPSSSSSTSVNTPHIPPRGEEGDSGPGNERPVRQRRQPSPGKQVFVLERKAKALEAQAKDLKDRHASECAMDTHWTTPEHQAEYRRLKAAAKQARDQIAAVEVGA